MSSVDDYMMDHPEIPASADPFHENRPKAIADSCRNCQKWKNQAILLRAALADLVGGDDKRELRAMLNNIDESAKTGATADDIRIMKNAINILLATGE